MDIKAHKYIFNLYIFNRFQSLTTFTLVFVTTRVLLATFSEEGWSLVTHKPIMIFYITNLSQTFL